MNKTSVLLVCLFYCTGFLMGGGRMDKSTYKTIFNHSSTGFIYIAEMDNTYNVKKKQTIDPWLNKNKPHDENRYAERIVSLLDYNDTTIQISLYFQYRKGTTATVIYEICFIDTNNNVNKINIFSIDENGTSFAFAKIMGDTLFI